MAGVKVLNTAVKKVGLPDLPEDTALTELHKVGLKPLLCSLEQPL